MKVIGSAASTFMANQTLTPELTRAEHTAFNMVEQFNDEREAIERSG